MAAESHCTAGVPFRALFQTVPDIHIPPTTLTQMAAVYNTHSDSTILKWTAIGELVSWKDAVGVMNMALAGYNNLQATMMIA